MVGIPKAEKAPFEDPGVDFIDIKGKNWRH